MGKVVIVVMLLELIAIICSGVVAFHGNVMDSTHLIALAIYFRLVWGYLDEPA